MLDRYLEQTEFASYEDFQAGFRLRIPEGFNFAYDVVDEWAATDPDKLALVWCNEVGDTARFTFGELKLYSDKAANVLRNLGVGRGVAPPPCGGRCRAGTCAPPAVAVGS
jgi:acetyl-CoA synthetase